MTWWEGLLIVAAGMAAGTINTVVGSGTLVTFPVLLALGYPPVVANISNSLGLVPGSVSGAIGYRAELASQRDRLPPLVTASFFGGILGALLLLVLPPQAFEVIVPVLIVLALILVVAQPRLVRGIADRDLDQSGKHTVVLLIGVFLTGVYGGYFGAAQGVLLLALLGVLMDADLQRSNAVKNLLAALVNLTAGLVFIIVGLITGNSQVEWLVVLTLAIGSTIGGQVGSRIGRRLPPVALRTIIVLVGLAAIVQLLVK